MVTPSMRRIRPACLLTRPPSRRPEAPARGGRRGLRLGPVAFALFAACVAPVRAQEAPAAAPTPAPSPESAPAPSPFPLSARVYFIDLKDGARVPLALHVRFGLVGMGVAPAGVEFPQVGHHHILIDAPLPPLDKPIPFDDNHIHLGSGETEVDIPLTPGPHTLQLLMGDKDHIPHDPPVASPVIHVVAAAPLTPSAPGTQVSFINLPEGQGLPEHATVYFGLQGMGVAPASVTSPNTGHHHLLIDADPPDPQATLPTDDHHLNFPDGATQTELSLPPGRHTLQLVFTDRQDRMFDPPVMSERVTVKVHGGDGEARGGSSAHTGGSARGTSAHSSSSHSSSAHSSSAHSTRARSGRGHGGRSGGFVFRGYRYP